MSSSSRDRLAEDTYEAQNDQHLNELHAKIRTIRGVTTDIHNDVESQNRLLDGSSDAFNSFTSSLSESSRRASQAFGLGSGTPKQYRIVIYSIASIIGLWMAWKILGWFWPGGPMEPAPL